jgi:D-amino-acid dehydrogenase
MRTLVLGAGVVGLATAWYLHADGHDVTVVERNDDAALESSFANGGQLSYSYVAPLAGPGVLQKVPSWLCDRASPMRFVPRADLAQWRWLLNFIRACNRGQSEVSTRRLLALASNSQRLMCDLLAQEPTLDFDHANAGKLVLYRSPSSFDAARKLLAYQQSLGCEQQALDAQQCVDLDPALASLSGHLQGGIYTPSEQSGDCYKFSVGLMDLLRARGVTFRLSTTVTHLKKESDGRVSVFADREKIEADNIVIAAGVASVSLLSPLGVDLPLYPLKGYSLTADITDGSIAPRVSITDFERKMVYARLGRRLRVAGMADITGRRADSDPQRVATLRQASAAAFPGAADFDTATPWCGLRPATPKGTPIIDRTPFQNLWLNVGQGALGFTLALASGRAVGDMIAARTPAIPVDGFSLRSA